MNPKSIELPAYLFHQGTNYRSQEFLGAHPIHRGRGYATVFRVWAPNAAAVSVVGDFNAWDRNYRTGNLGVRDPQEETV